MFELPEIVAGPRGLTVENADPDLLRELLDEYDAELERVAPEVFAGLRPGLAHGEITDKLGSAGLEATPEALVWWGWHDGVTELTGFGQRIDLIGLGQSLLYRAGDEFGEESYQWDPHWIRVAGERAKWGLALSLADPSEPLLRLVHAELERTTHGAMSDYQVVSLCTPITMWITQLREGWNRFDTNVPGSWIVDWSQAPESWQKLEMLQQLSVAVNTRVASR